MIFDFSSTNLFIILLFSHYHDQTFVRGLSTALLPPRFPHFYLTWVIFHSHKAFFLYSLYFFNNISDLSNVPSIFLMLILPTCMITSLDPSATSNLYLNKSISAQGYHITTLFLVLNFLIFESLIPKSLTFESSKTT